MSQVNVYFARMQSCRMVFPDGSEAAFIGGRYATDDADKIAYLDYEISKGHPHIFVDPTMRVIDTADLDPMEVMRKKIIAEYLEQQAAQALTSSVSIPEALKPASSAQLVDTKTAEEVILATGSEDQSSVSVGAKAVDLASLVSKK